MPQSTRFVFLAAALLAGVFPVSGQVITIDTHGNPKSGAGASVDRRFAQIQPTSVALTNSILDAKTRLELERVLQAEQGFAMRPFPRGHRGLSLEANGKLEPVGEAYLNMVTSQGLCAKPGDRLVITDLKFEKDKIIFMINGGPDPKHRFLRHVQIGAGAGGASTNPVVQDDGQQPTGARLTLTFKDKVPELTGGQVKALLAPLISFDVKTPIQAFTDTLPPLLKEAILNHRVLVGMTTDMVLFAVGPPESKTRESDGNMPFEEWIYGKPPQPVQFIRINGNRVIRTEMAKVGEPPIIKSDDVVTGMMRTDGTPLSTEGGPRTVALGDVVRDPNTQAAAAPPTLHKEGDQADPLTVDNPQNALKPVQFPTKKGDDYPDASRLPRNNKPADASQQDNPAADDDEQAPAKEPAKQLRVDSAPQEKPAGSVN